MIAIVRCTFVGPHDPHDMAVGRCPGEAAQRGPGRSSMGKRTATAIRLRSDLHERLAAAAAERDVSINFMMNKAAEVFLDRLIPIDEMRWVRDSADVSAGLARDHFDAAMAGEFRP